MRHAYARHPIAWSFILVAIIIAYTYVLPSTPAAFNAESWANLQLLDGLMAGQGPTHLPEGPGLVERDGAWISPYPLGPVVTALPGYAVYHLTNVSLGRTPRPTEALTVARWLGVLLPLLIFYWRFSAFTRRASEESAIRMVAVGALVVASPLWVGAGAFWGAPIFAVAVFGAHLLALEHRSRPDDPWPPVLAGASLGVALHSSAAAVPAVLLTVIVATYLSPTPKRFAALGSLALVPLAIGLAWYNFTAFGSPFTTPAWSAAPVASPLVGLARIVYVPPTGLLWLAPWSIIGLWDIAIGLTEPRQRNEAAFAAGIILLYAVLLPLRSSAASAGVWVTLPFLAYHTAHGLGRATARASRHVVFTAALALVLASSLYMTLYTTTVGVPTDVIVNPPVELGPTAGLNGVWPLNVGALIGLVSGWQLTLPLAAAAFIALIPLAFWSVPSTYARQGIGVSVIAAATVIGVGYTLPATSDTTVRAQTQSDWVTSQLAPLETPAADDADQWDRHARDAARQGEIREALHYYQAADRLRRRDAER